MTGLADALRDRLAHQVPTALVTVDTALGSTPRDGDARMLVDATSIAGTIGGGRLEFEAVTAARALLREGGATQLLDYALGPALDQCCGGRMKLFVRRADEDVLADLERAEQRDAAERPTVLLFGAGHVGRALADALALLPFDVRWIDERAQEFPATIPANATRIVHPSPASLVAQAPHGAAIVAVTHGHAEDFGIVGAALTRGDFAYVGMIGSDTKRVRFQRWFERQGGDPALLENLICPIGGTTKIDKRPALIAALVMAELIRAIRKPEGTTMQEICEGAGCGA